jgi:hypothetical protein
MRSFRSREDLRYLPLINRKLRLHAFMPKHSERLLTALTKHSISLRSRILPQGRLSKKR